MALLLPPGYQLLDSIANPIASGRVFVYENRTTTLKTIYSNPELTTAVTNPYPLDSNGRLNNGINLYGPDGDLFTLRVEHFSGAPEFTRNDCWGVSNLAALTLTTVAEVKALIPKDGDSIFLKTKGRYFYDIASGITGNEATVIVPDTGTGRWILDPLTSLDLRLYGNTNTAVQAAISDMSAQGGILRVQQSLITMAAEVHVNKPVLFLCDGKYDSDANSNTSGTALVTFRATSTMDRMFTFSDQDPASLLVGTTTGVLLFGGGIDGALLDGDGLAKAGIWSASQTEGKYNIQCREFLENGMIIDGGNNILSVRNEFKYHHVHGVSVPTRPSNGLFFRRYNTKPSTQNRIVEAHGLVYDGDLIVFEDTDNNRAAHVHGVTQSGGVGYAIRFANGATQQSRFNVIDYCNGDIIAESQTYGNRIAWHNSEASKVVITSGGQLHYRAVDYVNAEEFKTHSYDMSEAYAVPVGALVPDGSHATNGQFAGNVFGGIAFADAGTGEAYVSIPSPSKWHVGTITSIKLDIVTGGTSAGNGRWTIKIRSNSAGNSVTTPQTTESFTNVLGATADVITRPLFTFTTPHPHLNGDNLLINIARLGQDAADTNTDTLYLAGVTLNYVATGPDSAGSGPYDVGPVAV